MVRRFMRGIVWGAVMLAALDGGRPAFAQGISAQAPVLFKRYRAGETAVVLERIAGYDERQIDALVREVRRRVGAWVREAGNTDRARLDAATFLLDIAATRMEGDWLAVRDLVELGCRLIEPVPSTTPGVLRWHLAALALAEGAADSRFLVDARRSREAPTFTHLAHSRARFPDEPRFALAEAVVQGLGFTDLAPPRDQVWVPDEELAGMAVIGRVELMMRKDRRAMLDTFVRLTTVPAVANEAHLRAAHLAYQLNDDAAAMTHLSAAVQADDPFVDYVGYLLTALVQERRGDRVAAEASLRQALTVVPFAQSAVELLSAELFRSGRESEAHDLVDAFFARRNPPVDPWRVFGYGDFRRLPELMQVLRGELGR